MKQILLIEDDQIMRENTAEILELAQYKVVTASNGKDGSQLAREIKPDLIISDIMMPGLDGYGVLHLLSKDPTTSSIPFIFLTAKAEKSEWRKGMELGADDYITKPYEDTDLLNAIETRLKKNETFKKKYTSDAEGLGKFLNEAKGLKELEDLSKSISPSTYKNKEIIYHVGDTPDYLYFIHKGKVKTYTTHDDGKEFITNIFKQGDFFGYTALFEKHPYPESALVLEKSEICKIPRKDFLSLAFKNRDVSNQFIKMLSNQIEEKEKQLLSLAYDTVRKRTAEALITLKNQYADDKENSPIPITRENLARMAGTATETVIRCLSEFKEDQFVEINGREITILNIEGLSSIQ